MAIRIKPDGRCGFVVCDRCGAHIYESKNVHELPNIDMTHVKEESAWTEETDAVHPSGRAPRFVRKVKLLKHFTLCPACVRSFEEWASNGKSLGA